MPFSGIRRRTAEHMAHLEAEVGRVLNRTGAEKVILRYFAGVPGFEIVPYYGADAPVREMTAANLDRVDGIG